MGRVNPLFYLIYIGITVFFLLFGIKSVENLDIVQITLFLASLAILVTFFHHEWGLYLMIIAMLFSPELVLGRVRQQNIALRIEDILILAVSITWLARVAITKGLGEFYLTPVHKPFFLFITVCLFATAWGIIQGHVKSPAKGMLVVLKFFEFFLIYFMTISSIRDENRLKRALAFYFATMTAIVIYVIVSQPFLQPGYRVTTPFEQTAGGEPNTLGGYLAFSIAVLLGIALNMKNWIVKLAMFVTAGVGLVPFLSTLSRGSYLSMILSFFVLFLFSKRKMNFVLFLIVVCLVFSKYSLLVDKIEKRIEETFVVERLPGPQAVQKVVLDESAQARIDTIKIALVLWKNAPFIGRGVSGSGFVDSYFFRMLLEVGLVGTFLIGWTLFSVGRMCADLHRQQDLDDLHRGLLEGFMAGLVGLLGHSLGANTFLIVRITGPFWVVAGCVGALYLMGRRKDQLGESQDWRTSTSENTKPYYRSSPV